MPNVIVTVCKFDTVQMPLNAQNTDVNIQDRLRCIVEASDRAKAQWESYRGRILNLEEIHHQMVVAPEYAFIKAGVRPFLTEDEKERLRATIVGITQDKNDLILIPGTALWGKSMVRPESRQLKRGTNQLKQEPRVINKAGYREDIEQGVNNIRDRFYNRLYKGTGQSLLDIVDSWSKEELDPEKIIVRNSAFIGWNGGLFTQHKRYANFQQQIAEPTPNVDWQKAVFMPGGYRPCPPIFGMQIGVEICAEHEIAPLCNIQNNLNFHVILSASIEFNINKAAVRERGYIVHADTRDSEVYAITDGRVVTQTPFTSFDLAEAGRALGTVKSYICKV
ncbi:hypothetical protein ACX0MV_05985 [Pseudomonas borbori]